MTTSSSIYTNDSRFISFDNDNNNNDLQQGGLTRVAVEAAVEAAKCFYSHRSISVEDNE